MSYPNKPPLEERLRAFEQGLERYWRRVGQPRTIRLQRPAPKQDARRQGDVADDQAHTDDP